MSALKVSGRVTGILIDEASDESKRFWVCGFGEGIDCRFFRGRVEVPGVFDFVPSTRDFRRAEIFATGVFSFLVFLYVTIEFEKSYSLEVLFVRRAFLH